MKKSSKRCSRRRHQIDKAIEEFVAKKGRQPTAEEVKTMTLLTRNRKMLEKSETEIEAFKRSLLTAPERQRLYVLAENARIMGDLRFMDVEELDAVQQIGKVAAEKMSEQAFYVACSRGKFNLALHIPDKEFFKNKLLHLRTERLSVHDLSASGEIIAPVLPSAEQIRQNCRPVQEELMRKHNENVLIRMLKRIVQKVSGLFGGSPYNTPQAITEYRKGQALQMTVDNATEQINRKGEDHEQTIRQNDIGKPVTEERQERKITDNSARVPGTSKPPRKPGHGRGID